MRSDETLWECVKDVITKQETAGTRAGQWSARKAQLAVRLYKELGGTYTTPKPKKTSLGEWTKQDWTTKSGLPSSLTGERYLPRKAIEALTDEEYARTSRAKRRGTTQYVPQPSDIQSKTRFYR